MFFDTCKEVIGDIQDIQADEKNPNDCAKEPHEVTHTVDGVRYYCISRVLPAESEGERKKAAVRYEDEDESLESYEEWMIGSGVVSQSYLNM